MKTLYFDCGMGAAGDMLTAGLLELIPEPEQFVEELNQMFGPSVRVKKEVSVKAGIVGTKIVVLVDHEEEKSVDVSLLEQNLNKPQHDNGFDPEHHGYDHGHETVHEDSHEHIHQDEFSPGDSNNRISDSFHAHIHDRGFAEIREMINALPIPPEVRESVFSIYTMIAEVESKVHGVPVSEIHFHEVGQMDAIVDITAVCLLMQRISPDQVIVSPIHVGSGYVRCAHGMLPVPTPATAVILQNIPIYGGQIQGELCTPTGAAILRFFATRFGDMPTLRVHQVGYGMGTKNFSMPNCVRVMLGSTDDEGERIAQLSCNLDDMSPEMSGFAMNLLLEEGALDVCTIPIGMKKSRPGVLLCVLCRIEDREKMISLLLRHTSTIGVRETICQRYTLARETITQQTAYGTVRLKRSEGYGIVKEKYEFDDLARIAKERGISIAEVLSLLK